MIFYGTKGMEICLGGEPHQDVRQIIW